MTAPYWGSPKTGQPYHFSLDLDVSNLFRDVQASDWYSHYVSTAYVKEYMNGYPEKHTFGAKSNLTRAQAVQVLYNVAGARSSSSNSSFSDVSTTAWYAQCVTWAEKQGIVHGNNGKFNPSSSITREQFAEMLANYAKTRNDYSSFGAASAVDLMADSRTVSSWATEPVGWAINRGIMGTDGVIQGKSKITRAQVAAMIVRHLKI